MKQAQYIRIGTNNSILSDLMNFKLPGTKNIFRLAMSRSYVTDDVSTEQLSNKDRRPVVVAADQQRHSADSTS